MPIPKANVVGPFIVNYNDPNVLTSGVVLFTPIIGQTIYDLWYEILTSFAWTGGGVQTGYKLVAGAQTYMDQSVPARFGNAPNGATFRTQAAVSTDNAGIAPIRFVAATPLKLIMVPDSGSMTAGKVAFYALTS